MINQFFPIYFFPTLFTFSYYKTLPYLLFTGLIIDRIYYQLPFTNTILILLFYLISKKLKPCRKKRQGIKRTLLFTSAYLGILFLIYQKISLILLISQLIWNTLFTLCLFDPRRIYVKKEML